MVTELTEQAELLTEFDETLWCGLVNHMTVYRDGRIVYSFKAGIEIDASSNLKIKNKEESLQGVVSTCRD